MEIIAYTGCGIEYFPMEMPIMEPVKQLPPLLLHCLLGYKIVEYQRFVRNTVIFIVGDGKCYNHLINTECYFDGIDCCDKPELVGNELQSKQFFLMW